MKLNRFHSFNEVANPDVFKLDQNAVYVLNSDVSTSFVFYGSDEYTLNVYDDKQVCELITPHNGSIQMTYDEVPANKDRIIALEPTTAEGELLYKWIARNLSVIEWSNTSFVSSWHTFETEDTSDVQPLGSTGYQDPSALYYVCNAPNGTFGIEILRDLSTFKLMGPGMEDAVIGTLKDLIQNEKYYKSLATDDVIYNWIQFCFGRTLAQGKRGYEDQSDKTDEAAENKIPDASVTVLWANDLFSERNYILTMFPGKLIFKLKFPNGDVITSSYESVRELREYLLLFEDGAIYDWMLTSFNETGSVYSQVST
jgi:hypothetical protein